VIREEKLLASLMKSIPLVQMLEPFLRVKMQARITFHCAQFHDELNHLMRETIPSELGTDCESLELGEITEPANPRSGDRLVIHAAKYVRCCVVVSVKFLAPRAMLFSDINQRSDCKRLRLLIGRSDNLKIHLIDTHDNGSFDFNVTSP
jgi:hypothetical protein